MIKRRLKSVVLVTILAVVAFAQTTPLWDSPEINRVAGKMHCDCGCKLTMSCQMQPGCPVCKASKQKIYSMLASGKSEGEVLSAFVQEKGKDVLVVPPGTMGFVGPYIALALGFGFVLLALRYLRRRPAALPEVDPAVLARIDKD